MSYGSWIVQALSTFDLKVLAPNYVALLNTTVKSTKWPEILAASKGKQDSMKIEGTWCSSAKRENLYQTTFSCYHDNINYITHSHHKKITRTISLEYTFKSYEY